LAVGEDVLRGLDSVIDAAWQSAQNIPGFLTEPEVRFIGMLAAYSASTVRGQIVEIGSFKGRSTVILATVARHYGLPPVVAIDPHNFNSVELQHHRVSEDASSFAEFQSHLKTAGVSEAVEVHRAYSADLASNWNRPIGFLWIDGDHSYRGAKSDFDGFSPYLVDKGFVAFHDALHEFAGPIRVFAEDVLRSDKFGASGFVGSIAWSQYRPGAPARWDSMKESLARGAERLIPFVSDERPLRGTRKILYKLNRSRVPRSLPDVSEWIAQLQ
jgi:predicted O-methyltransferase YrrM